MSMSASIVAILGFVKISKTQRSLNEVCALRWIVAPKIYIAIQGHHTGNRGVVKPHQHDSVIVSSLDNLADNTPLKTAPLFLVVVIVGQKRDDEFGLLTVDVLQERVHYGTVTTRRRK